MDMNLALVFAAAVVAAVAGFFLYNAIKVKREIEARVAKKLASREKRSAAQKAAHARRKAPDMPRNEMNPTNGFDHVAH